MSDFSIAIIGTAGRKDDAPRMSVGLYRWMVMRAMEEIEAIVEATGNASIHLVSGGAAWADHVAVSLYLKGVGASLNLMLPAPFDIRQCCYIENGQGSPGQVANYYHGVFSGHMGRNTMEGIMAASVQGADLRVFDGFHARNREVGKVDALIAFTFADGRIPKDGGTAHTWRNSRAPIKVHVSLTGCMV
jgi:hypothetical protein